METISKKITIEVWGEDGADIEDGIEEAVRRIHRGNVVGAERGEDRGFSFAVKKSTNN